MSLQERAIIQVFSGLDLDKKRALLQTLIDEAQLVLYISPVSDIKFAKFLSREFDCITFNIYEKMMIIWNHLKTNSIGATRIRANTHVIVWNQPDGNYTNADHAIVNKDHILDLFIEDGHPRGLGICFGDQELSSLMEVFESNDPLQFLKLIDW